MLQADQPDTYVLATNRTEPVRDFVRMAFNAAGITVEFSGTAENEIATDVSSGKILMRVNPQYYRPGEVDLLIGDCAKPNAELGWDTATTLEDLCNIMVAADLGPTATGNSF